MEALNRSNNTEQTVLLFQNLNKQSKYTFFQQIEEDLKAYYQEYFLASTQKTIPFTENQFLQDIKEAKQQIINGEFQTIEDFEKETALWK